MEYLTELLADKGRLKIITHLPNPNRPPGSTDLDPSYFNQVDVVRIDVKGDSAKAYAEDGTCCMGQPSSLLARLTEWHREKLL